jgi:hypothetical protein
MKKLFAVAILGIIGICVLGPKAEATPAAKPAQVHQVVFGGWCCNQAGYRVCEMTFATPVGTGCCCPGVGCGGYVCI